MQNQKIIIVLLIILIISLFAFTGFYYWKNFYNLKKIESQNFPVMTKKAEPKSFGEELYSEIKTPASAIPQTNPYSVKTNPFEGVNTNPFKGLYQNPFAK